ncbi:hypothetical protein [Natranaerobius thermophilus]|uniref:Lantibiotic ABC transporter n=1 Tax=Natranaerobius thermophilus (strain ATCC BAA-1301 / DSM 18059 / JW/NM-WN-LF) TaxID=457570 RepID=B2A6I9_NATTJ|nr:hypothetical protein [Natranaerobius thermophilus]ACB85522.1 conserved hypothetical protein [Natranaerobius thermophilus JW/NM-WN-LF]
MAHLSQAVYFAPRGRWRLLELGDHILRHYISIDDKLIGFVGGPGAGKSVLIEGMLKEFTLTNDDNGVNIRPLPILEAYYNGYFKHNTYHIDAQFELAFYTAEEITKAIITAISHERRVIIEHFEKIYPYLNINAQVLIGVGEEVIVTRPQLFGPDPKDLSKHVERSLIYRKMAHTAEELVSLALKVQNWSLPNNYSEVQHGFVMEFDSYPDIDLQIVDEMVNEWIKEDLPVHPEPENNRLQIGDYHDIYCTGPRVHVRSTGEIESFQLNSKFVKDPILQRFMLIGRVGEARGSLLSFNLE